MPSTNKENKIKTNLNIILQSLKKVATFNIGTVIFAALFLYMVFSLILYVTSSHFRSYQVVNGPLSRNETYTGLAIHEEEVVSADVSGYINYYAREGTKLNASGVVYGISSSPQVTSDVSLSADDLSRVRKQMSNFSYGFNPSNFNSTYSFKSELEGNILQYAEAEVTSSSDTDSDNPDSDEDEAEEETPAITLGNQVLSRTTEDGIILYSKDGYEDVTAENISKEHFDQNSYHKEDLKTREPIQAGDDVYSVITDERWSVYIPLSDKQAAQLTDRTAIRVKFLKDGLSQTGDFSIVEIDGGKYGKLDFNNGLIRYASDRFLDIELVTNTTSGLKIPLSSVITKEFYLIPKDYQTRGGNDQEAGFLVERDGAVVFESATVYAERENMYYVEKSTFDEGTILVKPESEDRYVIGDTGNLEGVYCINEGYARFRRILIIDQNEEYCIVEKGTGYGLSQYDHIVFDAADVDEEDILY